MIGFLLVVVVPVLVLGTISWFLYRRPKRLTHDTSVDHDTDRHRQYGDSAAEWGATSWGSGQSWGG